MKIPIMDIEEAEKCFNLIVKTVDPEGYCVHKGNILKVCDRNGNPILASSCDSHCLYDCHGNYFGTAFSAWTNLLYGIRTCGLVVTVRSEMKNTSLSDSWQHISNFKRVVRIPSFSSYEEVVMHLTVMGYDCIC